MHFSERKICILITIIKSHYLNQCWPDSLTHICGTGERWVNDMIVWSTLENAWVWSLEDTCRRTNVIRWRRQAAIHYHILCRPTYTMFKVSYWTQCCLLHHRYSVEKCVLESLPLLMFLILLFFPIKWFLLWNKQVFFILSTLYCHIS